MATQQRLSHDAYGGIDGKDYVPFVSAKTVMQEFTLLSFKLFGRNNIYNIAQTSCFDG
jgi:hypothetical protein